MKKTFFAVLAATAPGLIVAGPVDINSADAETIAAELNGVGLSKAQAIVAYRSKNGAFAAPEEVLNVKGIGPQIYSANRKDILVGESREATDQ